MSLGDKFRLLLTTTLREDGVPDDGDFLTMGKYCLFCPPSPLPKRKLTYKFVLVPIEQPPTVTRLCTVARLVFWLTIAECPL